MWFKNLHIYSLKQPFTLSPDTLDERLSQHAFQPSSSIELQRMGWVPPRPAGMRVHAVGGQLLLTLRVEKKLLPASVINQFAKARAQDIESEQGYKPGRKQMKEIKEAVTNELLPRAFALWRDTDVWIDPLAQRLMVNAAASVKADEALQLISKNLPELAATPLQTRRSPVSAMTAWLSEDEAPGGFTIDQDTELRACTHDKATVRYVRHAVEAEEMRRHISAGKQCTRLALTWMDRVSFVLGEQGNIKRIAALDVLTEAQESGLDETGRLDADFALMTGELRNLIDQLIEALGGLQPAPAA